MGYTDFEKKLIEPYLNKVKSVLDFGSCNDYTDPSPNPKFISEWYKEKGIDYTCIDMAGDNNALVLNWSYPIRIGDTYSLVVDAGSSEHSAQANEYPITSFHEGYINSVYPKGEVSKNNIEQGYFNCWLNKHNLLKIGGIMININPMTSMWENHGYSYLGENFYEELVKISGYELIETGLNGATGNWETGVNVYGVIKKISDLFPGFETFSGLPIYKS